MKLAQRIGLAALAGAVTFGAVAATPAEARGSISIEYRDGYYGNRYYGDRYRDDWRARQWQRDRWEQQRRYDNYYRGGYDRGYGYDRGGWGGYRGGYDRCWTEWRRDRWGGRDAIRVCR